METLAGVFRVVQALEENQTPVWDTVRAALRYLRAEAKTVGVPWVTVCERAGVGVEAMRVRGRAVLPLRRLIMIARVIDAARETC